MQSPAKLLLLLVAALGLAACTDPARLGAGGGDDPLAGPGAGVGTGGGAAAPSSPAYFREEVGDRVLFTVDRSDLDAEARATLDGQARWLQRNPEFQVVIEGHADERGTRQYNLALGARRANSVEEYLVSQGVAAGRLRTVSYGKERPVALCSEQRCYNQNRRAVTVVTAGAGV